MIRKLRARVLAGLKVGLTIGSDGRAASGVELRPGKGRIEIGRKCVLERGVVIRPYKGTIRIGDRCSLNPYTVVYGSGDVRIGNYVRIAAHSVIVASNHRTDRIDIPIKNQGNSAIGITIEDDVWIGANCVVLDGAILRKGCVLAAGSVLRGDTVPYGIYAGSPAVLKRVRGSRSGEVA